MNKLTKVFALLLVVALASTTFYVGTQLNSTVSTLGDEQNVSPVDLESSLEFDPLHVSIEGESKLHVNESSTYQAVVSGGSGNFGYLWSVDPVDEKVVFEYSGGTCGFMFVVATVDPYTLSVEVTDLVSGDKAFGSFTIYDPYTLPDLYLEASLANFVCRVKSDGAGWFFVSDGESGKTLFSSTVLLNAINYALTSTTSGNVLLDGVYFDYSLDIPVGVSVIECVDGLTRVFVNAANSQGSPYTISVDTVQTGYYMAQDSMGRFIDDLTSTNASYVHAQVNSALTSGIIMFTSGNFVYDGHFTTKANISYVGAGKEKTVITLADNKNIPLVINENVDSGGTWDENIMLQGFTFDGNGENQVSATFIRTRNVPTMYWDHVRYSDVRDCVFRNGYDYNMRLGFSYDVGYVQHITVRDTLFNRTFNVDGGNSDGFGDYVTYINCVASHSARDGFCYWGKNIKYIDCSAFLNDKSGFFAESADTDQAGTDRYYINCNSYNNTEHGLAVYRPSRVVVDGGKYVFNGQYGIWIRGTYNYNNLITNAEIVDNSISAANTYMGIFAENSGGSNTISHNLIGNLLTNNQRRAVTVANGHNNQILYNKITGCADWSITFSSSNNTLIQGNSFIGNAGGIYIAATAFNTKIYDNNFEEQITSKLTNLGTFTNVKDNQAFVTETSGSAVNTTATTVVVTHGLAGTPNAGIFASFNDTGITGYTVTAISSTQITFTIQGTPANVGWLCYWRAEYKP